MSSGSGYRYVFVNGQITIQDDKQTEVYAGQLLRGGVADMEKLKTRRREAIAAE